MYIPPSFPPWSCNADGRPRDEFARQTSKQICIEMTSLMSPSQSKLRFIT